MTEITKINLPVIREGLVAGKSVIIRADLEADSEMDPRFVATKKMVDYLSDEKAGSVKVIGHQGKIWMVEALGVTVNYDLRSDPREEANSVELAAELAYGFDIYINEAFGTSHRKHTSIDALPRWMKKQGFSVYCGSRFKQEVDTLSKLKIQSSNVKSILVIGGIKRDKEKYADDFEKRGWLVLRGGLLPGVNVRSDGLDITTETVANYKSQIASAKVIVAAGVMGKYEDPSAQFGTKEILQAIANSSAYKIAGGGDIEAAISKYGLTSKFDWISVGGGAMLEFLATGTLPGIEALL